MNDFFLFEQLCALENITKNYKNAQAVGTSIRSLEEYMKNRRYKVAFIGEFKRGKSSLINALIGSRVLPTDILPMTAAITHIRYSDMKQIIIHYKDGKTEEKSIEELIDFATKFDEQKEKVSQKIKEVMVDYPSILCRNNIEIFDTPGMNDDEHMSDITLGILGDIDAAIMVISAGSPMSITEKELILHMIKHKGIRHIVFVVTYIDAVSDEIEEQDKIIAFIKKRISSEVLKNAEERFADDENILKKARRILSDPHIYGVSSVLAMEGFTEDSRKKLKLSRIPVFKQELLEYLTAAQGVDAKEIFIDALGEVEQNIESWYDEEQQQLLVEKQDLIKLKSSFTNYFSSSPGKMPQLLAQMGVRLNSIGLLEKYPAYSDNLYKAVRKMFIKRLFEVREESYSQENLTHILQGAINDAQEVMDQTNEMLSQIVSKTQTDIMSAFLALRPQCPGNEAEENLIQNCKSAFEEQISNVSYPVLRLDIKLPEKLIGVNLIAGLETELENALRQFGKNVEGFEKNWKAFVLEQHKTMWGNKDVIAYIDGAVVEINAKRSVMEYNFPQDKERLEQIKKLVESVE